MPASAAPQFSPAVSFGVGQGPVAVATVDLNGDGRADLAAANNDSGSLSVRLNRTAPGAATPSFTSPTTVSFGAGSKPQHDGIATGDFDGAYRRDMAVGDAALNKVWVLLNQTAPGASTATFSTTSVTFP